MAYTFRMAAARDKTAVVAFMRAHWGGAHPLVEREDFFNYYYAGPNGRLNFVLCEEAGRLAALAGFIPASAAPHADAWVSLWIADAAARGSGMELMAALPGVLGCRTLACNNIRPKTLPFYRFLGWQAGRVGHFYRLANKPKADYRLTQVASRDIPQVGGAAALSLLPTPEALYACGFEAPQAANPYKDAWYIARRYYAFPGWAYRLYAAALPGEPPFALLALRHNPVPEAGAGVLRLVDVIGDAARLPEAGAALDALLGESGAEYMDCYCAGLPAPLLRAAGFAERAENSPNVIPNYLNPPLRENTEYYYFTGNPKDFVLFRADGDQDRPNWPN